MDRHMTQKHDAVWLLFLAEAQTGLQERAHI